MGSWRQFFVQKSSSLKVGQPERTRLGLLVLLKLWENGELFRVVLLWQVSFREGCRGGDRGTAEAGMGGHHKLLSANIIGGIYFWSVLPGAGGKQTPPPDPIHHWELCDGYSQVPNRGMGQKDPISTPFSMLGADTNIPWELRVPYHRGL